MKKLKKLASVMLALVMVFAMSATAFAASDYVITVENSVTGSTYDAYKVFAASYNAGGSAVTYTISADDAWYDLVSGTTTVTDEAGSTITTPFTLTASTTSGTYNVTTSASETEVAAWFNAITADQLTAAGITAAATGTGDGSAIELDVTSPGYYYITTTSGSTVTVTTAKPTATAVDKNETPGSGGGTDYDKSAEESSYQIGESVPYTITAYVPTYDGSKEIYLYTFTDELPTGLTPDEDSVIVTITDGSDNEVTVPSNAITVDVTGQTITVSYDPHDITGYPADASIEINYTATVNSDATYNLVNEVVMNWSDSKGTEIPSTPPEEEETIYVYGFNLQKRADTTTGTLLQNAQFKLTYKDDNNEDVNVGFVTSTDGSGHVTYKVSTDTTASTYTTTITAGDVTIFGLDADKTYTLTETVAPSGYNLASAQTVTVGQNGSYNTSTGINTNTVIVVDVSGTALPSTGGIGTTIFYVVGGTLVLAAAVLLITRKRMGNAE